MEKQVSGVSGAVGNSDDVEYDKYLRRMQQAFLANINGMQPLFTTDAAGVWDAYLAALPDDQRQYHNCHACRHFIERFGHLVTIWGNGFTTPAIWHGDDAPMILKAAVHEMERIVRRANVTGVFLSSAQVWGTPITLSLLKGNWRHFAVTPPKEIIYQRMTQTAGQAMAEKLEDFKNVMRALNEFTRPMLVQALQLLQTETLYRSEKLIGPARWLFNLHENRDTAPLHGSSRANIVWRAVATAPAGFCHPRSSMIGTLLEDIAAGLPFAEVSRRFADKMQPLRYQRPQMAPSAGNIAQAEKIVEQLGIRESLRRRYARLEEIEALWRPAPVEEAPKGEGVFAHLKPREAAAAPISGTDLPPTTMTWEKFQRTVLPEALEIEFHARHVRDGYIALVTAAAKDAPPILQWDSTDRRNPVSWYLYNRGSHPEEWGLVSGQWHKVNAITLKPSMWGDDAGKFAHHGKGVIFIIQGARDFRNESLALLPETLKSELHSVRATIEEFSRVGRLEGENEASACGIALFSGGGRDWDALFRVRTKTGTVQYKLDRWD